MNIQTINNNIKRLERLALSYINKKQEAPEWIYAQINHWNKLHEDKIMQINGLGDLNAPYIPASKGVRLNVDVPDKMDDETHAIIDMIDKEVGGVDEYVRKKLHFKTMQEMFVNPENFKGLSAEQIDAVALAIYNIEKRRQFVIISDQTGIGKGRIAASIIRYAHYMNKKPIFLTIDASLFSDMYRDLEDIYMDDMHPIKIAERDADGNIKETVTYTTDPETGEVIERRSIKYSNIERKKGKTFVPFILNQRTDKDPSIKNRKGDIVYEVKTASNKDRKEEYDNVVLKNNYHGYDCFMLTYSQLQVKENDAKIEWLKNVIKDNIVILDESHLASGDGQRAKNIIKCLPLALGGLFLSATYAKFPKNMPLYSQTTAIKYAGLNPDNFVFAMIKGGTALQEVLSSQLVQSGCLIRRERPLSNVTFNYIVLDKYGNETFGVPNKEIEHNNIFDNITRSLRGIIKFHTKYVNQYIKDLNEASETKYTGETAKKESEALSYKSSPAFNKVFQIVNQTLFALKAEETANRAIQRLKNGQKPVITFDNTMETWMERLEKVYGRQQVNSDYSLMLAQALESVMHFQEIKTIKYTEKDESGKDVEKITKIPTPVILKPEDLPASGKDYYYYLADTIKSLEVGISLSPIDVIKRKIEDAGFKVAEITGRKTMFEFNKGDNLRGRIVPNKKQDKKDIIRGFQENEIDCILLNASGATGISLHAVPIPNKIYFKSETPPKSLTPKNEVKQRCMIIAQPNLDINNMVQTWGRINRSGQVYLPEYDFVSLAVPAEQRLMLFLQRKMHSLDANTSSNQKQNADVLDMQDFMNKYGDLLVVEWIHEHEDLNEIMDRPLWHKPRYKTKEAPENANDVIYDEKGFVVEYESTENAAQTVSGRVALLETKDQRDFYDIINERYTELIKKLDAENRNDLEIKFVPLNAVLKNKKIHSFGQYADNPFAGPVIINELECDVMDKPYTKQELENHIFNSLNGEMPNQLQDRLIKSVEKEYESRFQNRKKEIEELLIEEKKRISEMPSLKKILEDEGKEAYEIAYKEKAEKMETEKRIQFSAFVDKEHFEKNNLLQMLKKFKVGNGCKLDIGELTRTENGDTMPLLLDAVCVGIKIEDSKTGNPFAPSKVKFQFAATTGKKLREYSLTKTGGYNELVNSIHATETWYKSLDFREKWEAYTLESTTKTREIRYVISGNILAAYKDFSGQLVDYTMADGSSKKGMLMSKGFKPDMSTEVDLIYLTDLIKTMNDGQRYSTNSVKDNQEIFDGITFEKERKGIRVDVAQTAKNGAMYFKNASLIRLLDDPYSGFRKIVSGGVLSAYLPVSNVEKFLQVLHYELEAPPKIKISDFVLERIKHKLPNQKEHQSNEKISKIIRMEAKFVSIANLKAVAGLNSVDVLTPEEKKALKQLQAYRKQKKIKDNGLSGLDIKNLNI